jgi:hypothetical protein
MEGVPHLVVPDNTTVAIVRAPVTSRSEPRMPAVDYHSVPDGYSIRPPTGNTKQPPLDISVRMLIFHVELTDTFELLDP